MLAVLDQLTNINKHRHVLGTLIENRLVPGDLPPRHYVEARISSPPEGGSLVTRRILSYIAFEDSSVRSIEISSVLNSLSIYLIEEVFSRFERFFE